ncbi:hypothetical protein KPTHUN262_10610 [Klebsiella pneumoniae]|nr:hypothetical protein KPTHUN262_10610 [Klebsiella pneumoniae]GMW41163.1 hypothetical protein LOCUS_13440 [Klebsiella pneumoniae]
MLFLRQKSANHANTIPAPQRAASSRLSSVEIWQKLLEYLLEKHYGLTLNGTPFCNDSVIQKHIDAGISL